MKIKKFATAEKKNKQKQWQRFKEACAWKFNLWALLYVLLFLISCFLYNRRDSLVAQKVKSLPVMQETRVQSGRSPGDGNSNPLQYSCLENHMDGGAWLTTVHGSQSVRHDWVTSLSLSLTIEKSDRLFGEKFAGIWTVSFPTLLELESAPSGPYCTVSWTSRLGD